jgi:hypothetical protein
VVEYYLNLGGILRIPLHLGAKASKSPNRKMLLRGKRGQNPANVNTFAKTLLGAGREADDLDR